MKMAVKLKNLSIGKPGNYTVKFSAEAHAELLAYVEAYQEDHGTDIPVDALIAGIVTEYISSDTEFLAWKKAKGGSQPGGKGKRKAATTDAPPPASEQTTEAV